MQEMQFWLFVKKEILFMYELNKKPMAVHVKLQNGIYFPIIESAVGKTYLYTLLQEYGGTEALAFTYQDSVLGVDVESVIRQNNPKLILFDRYDLYCGQYRDVINEFSQKAIIILDCKNGQVHGVKVGWCQFILAEHLIEVIDCDSD